jgi:hypothetical protein
MPVLLEVGSAVWDAAWEGWMRYHRRVTEAQYVGS